MLDDQVDVRAGGPRHVAAAIMAGQALQIMCDGGYRNSMGAAAAVAFLVDPVSKHVSEPAGIRGHFIQHARSPFEMEVLGAELGVDFASDVARHIRVKTKTTKSVKRVRFRI